MGHDLCRYASQIVIDAIIFSCFFLFIPCHKLKVSKKLMRAAAADGEKLKRQQQQHKISILTTSTSLSITDHVSFGRRYICLLRPLSAHCQFKICICGVDGEIEGTKTVVNTLISMVLIAVNSIACRNQTEKMQLSGSKLCKGHISFFTFFFR